MLPTRDDIDTTPVFLSTTDKHLYMQKVGAINYLSILVLILRLQLAGLLEK